jgi:methionyl-tRNA formyltransferase
MPHRLVLLTGPLEAKFLLPQLERAGGDCTLVHADTLEALERACALAPARTRILAFCTAVIVPASILDACLISYNIHPGPPSFPGRHPECWGAYRGVTRFGATLHEMAPRVDEGAIVDVHWIDVPAGSGQTEFGLRALRAAFMLFLQWAPALMGSEQPLPRSTLQWSGRKTRHADITEMCRFGPDIDREEFERRRRAFAEAQGSRMTLDLFGHEFHYTVPVNADDDAGDATESSGAS